MNPKLKKICKSTLIALGIFTGMVILLAIGLFITESIKGFFRLTALHMFIGLAVLFFIILIIAIYDELPNHKKTTYAKEHTSLNTD